MSAPDLPPQPRIVRRIQLGDEDEVREARERAAALAALRHPGLAAPLEVAEVAPGVVEARYPAVPGDDVGAVVAAHGKFTVDQCVWLGVAILQTLVAVHTSGHVHGDVSPANIIISPAGPVLVDLMPNPQERGTPGYAAPERAVKATAACDIYALGRVLEHVVDDDGAVRLRAWTAPMTAPDPHSRPDAATAANALGMCAEPTPIVTPELDPAGLLRMRAIVAIDNATTERDPATRRWRIERRLLRTARGIAAVSGIGILAWLGAVAIGEMVPGVTSGREPPPVEITPGVVIQPDEAAASLVVRRAAALDASNGEQLVALTYADTSAREEASVESAALAAGAIAYDGLDVKITTTVVVETSDDRAVVAVTLELEAYTLWIDGVAERIPAHTESVEVSLHWTTDGWLIEQLHPLASPTRRHLGFVGG